jgi:two-component system chemotaxis response regulator CheB
MEKELLPGPQTPETLDQIGERSTQTCPKCGGFLWEVSSLAPVRLYCCVGHNFTWEALLQERSMQSVRLMWAAVRAFQEKHSLLAQLADEERKHNRIAQADEFDVASNAASKQGKVLRQIVTTVDVNQTSSAST